MAVDPAFPRKRSETDEWNALFETILLETPFPETLFLKRFLPSHLPRFGGFQIDSSVMGLS
jgi:hypothetical protein